MRDAAIRVMGLQPEWSDKNTQAMQERGHLIRDDIPDWLRIVGPRLSKALGPCGLDFFVEGRTVPAARQRSLG